MQHPISRRVVQQMVAIYLAIVLLAAGVLIGICPAQARGIAGMTTVAAAAGVAVAYIGKRRVRRRLHELRQAAEAMAEGRPLTGARRLPNDDFVKLSASVERLAAQLREMSAEQDRLRQRLTRSEKLAVMGELAATVAHEVNNPLDGLQNSIRIIRRRMGEDTQAGPLLALMEAGLSRIEKTVRRLLTMSRDEPIEPVPTPVQQITDEALAFVEPRLNRYSIGLIREFPDEPVIVQADAHHMAQALINLMINAADAMHATGGTLTLRCTADDGSACIEVADTGTGIAEQHLPHIFEPFYSTKGRGAGTGLGLSVVASVVEAHHGCVEVQTSLGAGTTFRIRLPLAAQRN